MGRGKQSGLRGVGVGIVVVAALVASAASVNPSKPALAAADPNTSTVRQDAGPWQLKAGMQLIMAGSSSSTPQTSPGAQMQLELRMSQSATRMGPAGDIQPSPPEIAEMRYCIVTRETPGPRGSLPPVTCEFPESWEPYANRRNVTVETDWIGPGEVAVLVQLRRSDGVLVPGVSPSGQPMEHPRASLLLESAIDPSVPVESLSPAAQALIDSRLAGFPVLGSVKIKNSPCCIGGTVGGTATAHLTFAATSQHGEVAEMQVGSGGCNTGQLGSSPAGWEPFAAQRDVPVTLTSGWSTYAVAVQYRDAAGNLSRVACDSIGAEGMPPRP